MAPAAVLTLSLLLQWELDYRLLVVEDARREAAPLVEALRTGSVTVKRQAIRALGRFERPDLAEAVLPFLGSEEAELRIAAANALAQMKAPVSLVETLDRERDPRVRAALFEALGRLPGANEARLVDGLGEEEPVRYGAAKGLEHHVRVSGVTPRDETISALREAVRTSVRADTKKLALLALNRAGDRHRETLAAALTDTDAEVRRLAVLGSETWTRDRSYIVRYAALRVAPDCARAEEALRDTSEHLVLLAIDVLGNGCSVDLIETLVDRATGWRRPAHAIVALAKTSPRAARKHLRRFARHRIWQARAYAARAAKLLEDEETLGELRADPHPNVVAAALVTPEQALAALERDDYGLLMAALELMKGYPGGRETVEALTSALERISARERATSRDPRRLMLERLGELASDAGRLDYLLTDFDPFIAGLAASVISEKTGEPVDAVTKHFAKGRPPQEDYLRGLAGARARFRMKEAGSFEIELLPDEAPFTVAGFARLAEEGYYDGLTFHRVVPNFVLQGGSPGANEYEGTPGYIRDEVGQRSHRRGTLGISTRGRDTGDGQIFINLVDNYRLDHDYTVFARVVDGMETVDRILEGDVMVDVEILRR